MAMFTHVVLGTNDLDKARAFYDKVLGALGYSRLGNMDTASFYGTGAPELMLTKPANGKPATAANGGTVSFAAPNRAAVNEFHKQALAAGGKCEGPPGPRAVAPTAYAAYIRDLDGNKLATYCFAAE
jgi:catechol 2,3-dioxygenase-like lactoylglutathione lyase family enzyme